MNLKKYKDKEGNIIAYKINFNMEKYDGGTNFITESFLPMQLSIFSTKFFKHLPAHIHLENKREIKTTSEFIFVLKGNIKVNIFDKNENIIDTFYLRKEEALLQFEGGHEFFIEPNTIFFELKQGPYLGKDKDKKEIKGEIK